jgi:hypothetical protein
MMTKLSKFMSEFQNESDRGAGGSGRSLSGRSAKRPAPEQICVQSSIRQGHVRE